jgi:hypothetical protein
MTDASWRALRRGNDDLLATLKPECCRIPCPGFLMACAIRERRIVKRRLKARFLKEESAMRVFIFGALVALAGCASPSLQQSKTPQPKPGTALAFSITSRADFEEGQTRAKEWCAETYSAPAQYIEERVSPTGRIAVFGCATN